MGMPKNLVLVRHGESEANIIQKSAKKNKKQEFPEIYKSTPDREVRLSSLGREQTVKTGQYLKEKFPEGFDVIYVSDHTRAKETAALVCKHAGWNNAKIKVDPQLGERNWGDFHHLSPEKRAELLEAKKRSPLHAPFPNGETLLQVRTRSLVFLNRCSRQYEGKNVLVFSHGEYIESIWSEIADMRTEEQKRFFESETGNIKNCQVVEIRSDEKGKLSQFKTSNPHLGEEGIWTTMTKTTFSPDELLEEVETYPHMLKDSKPK